MKRLVVTLIMLLTSGAVYALPVGNPSEASLYVNGIWSGDNYRCDPCDATSSWFDSWSVRVGYYGDFVFNRHMRRKQRDSSRSTKIRDTRISTNAAYLAFNVCNLFDIFTTLGATDLKIGTNATAISGLSTLVDLEFKERFSWSIGARATLWKCNCFTIGAQTQYFQGHAQLDHLVRYDTGASLSFSDEHRHQRYKEWQAGLGASYRFSTSCPTVAFIPYTGVKWSTSNLYLNNITLINEETSFTIPNLRSDKHWGWALGITLELCDMIGVSAEGRWGDENGLYINGQFRF